MVYTPGVSFDLKNEVPLHTFDYTSKTIFHKLQKTFKIQSKTTKNKHLLNKQTKAET
jgi:hypothetical protein